MNKHAYRARHARPRGLNSGATARVAAIGMAGLLAPLSAAHVPAPGTPARPAVIIPDTRLPDAMIREVNRAAIVAAELRAAHLRWLHIAHVAHMAHEERLAEIARAAALAAARARQAAAHPARLSPAPASSTSLSGHLTYGQLEQLWELADGPAWAAAHMAEIAECESGGDQMATNPQTGAAGYFQIYGQVIGGWIYDPMVNARNAVVKFNARGFEPWVCT